MSSLYFLAITDTASLSSHSRRDTNYEGTCKCISPTIHVENENGTLDLGLYSNVSFCLLPFLFILLPVLRLHTRTNNMCHY